MDYKDHLHVDFKPMDKVSKKEAKEEIDALREAIEYHNYLYYIKNSPEISDALYDKLFARLRELEDAFSQFASSASPTQKIGVSPVEAFEKIDHTAPMFSLNSVHEFKEVEKFVHFVQRETKKDLNWMLEPKFDGFSVEVVFKKGEFAYASTRGNGQKGEDISKNLKTIPSLPLHLRKKEKIPSLLAVRGEVYMSKKGFARLNKERIEKGEEPLANPRNAAAGLMRQFDSRKIAGKPMEIFFYEIQQIEDVSFESHNQMLKQLPKWGLRVDEHNQPCSTLKEMNDYHQKMSKIREEFDYEIDGIVIKLDDYSLGHKLGSRQRSPRWALAWKFKPKEKITRIVDIVVQVGRTGVLTPVALLEPVDVGGVTVSRATLHNEDEIHKKDIRVGDKVHVIRAGDVIPEIKKRIKEQGRKRSKKFNMPAKCPACGADIYKEGAYYYCPAGLSCPAQIKGRIIHFASRQGMNIEHLGGKTSKELLEKGLVHNISDLYLLSVEDIIKLEGFAQKSAQQLIDAIQTSKQISLDRFLYALGIRQVGAHIARVLADHYRSLSKLVESDKERFEKIKEIGPQIARSIQSFFKEESNLKVITRFQKEGVKIESKPKKQSQSLKGKTFVFTGALKRYTREEAKQKVEELGARTSSSVSSRTDYVIVGENPGSKLEDAKKEKTRIVKEKEFEMMLGQKV